MVANYNTLNEKESMSLLWKSKEERGEEQGRRARRKKRRKGRTRRGVRDEEKGKIGEEKGKIGEEIVTKMSAKKREREYFEITAFQLLVC